MTATSVATKNKVASATATSVATNNQKQSRQRDRHQRDNHPDKIPPARTGKNYVPEIPAGQRQ